MRKTKIAAAVAKAGITSGLLLLPLTNAYAVPSFARQTGMTCAACHTVFPQLTPFGRSFKLDGYTLTGKTYTAQGQNKQYAIDKFAPLSAMLQISATTVKKAAAGTASTDINFPEQLSFFYAGRLSDSLGAFIQATYDGTADHFGMDNTDVRYAKRAGNGLVYGLTLNNNPTVQDLWNSTPGWGYPYAGGPGLDFSSQIDGALGTMVAGLGGYAYFANQFYAEFDLYGPSQIGGPHPADTTAVGYVHGAAPYWRLAWQHAINGAQNIEVGAYGMDVKEYPTGVTGATDEFNDVAVDAQYQYISNPTTLTVHANYISEKAKWNASFPAGGTSNPSDNLHTLRLDATYYNNRTIGGTVAYFSTTGGSDAAYYGTDTGKPNSDGMVYELDYLPWLNTKFTLQYTAYNKFDGSSSGASDNNSLYVSAWLMF